MYIYVTQFVFKSLLIFLSSYTFYIYNVLDKPHLVALLERNNENRQQLYLTNRGIEVDVECLKTVKFCKQNEIFGTCITVNKNIWRIRT